MDLALFEAARDGNCEILLELLKHDPLLLERIAPSSVDTPLHVAAMLGNINIVKEILKRKRNVGDYAGELNQDGFTPLHMASANGDVEVVRVLLEISHGLCSVKGRDGKTPLHCAASKGRVNVISELVAASPLSIKVLTERNETALHVAVKVHQNEALGKLVEMLKQHNMVEILNWKDEEGNTVLHLAATRKNRQAIEILLRSHTETPGMVEVNATNKNGLTALDLLQLLPSESSSSREIERLLECAGAARACNLNSMSPASPHTHNPGSTSPSAGSNNTSRLGKSPWEDYFKFKSGRDKPSDVRNALLVVVVLMATATYQAVLSPPGGVNEDGENVGNARLAKSNPSYFIVFMVFNSAGFFVSQYTILVLTIDFPFYWELVVASVAMACTYDTAMVSISPPGAMKVLFTLLAFFLPVSITLLSRWIRKWYMTFDQGRGMPRVYQRA